MRKAGETAFIQAEGTASAKATKDRELGGCTEVGAEEERESGETIQEVRVLGGPGEQHTLYTSHE